MPYSISREYKRGKYQCTFVLLFDWLGISCMTTDNFCFYLQNRLIQTNQTGGPQYSDTYPFSILWYKSRVKVTESDKHSSLLLYGSNFGCNNIYGRKKEKLPLMFISYPSQGTLTKGEGSVRLTSSLR